MANNLELSQFASFIEVDDVTKNISVALDQEQFIGIGISPAICKLDVLGSVNIEQDARINGITTSNGPVSLLGPVEIRSGKSYSGIGSTVGVGVTEIPAALSVAGDLLMIGKSFFLDNTEFTGGTNTFYNNVNVYGQFITTSFSQLGGPTQVLGIATFSNNVVVESPGIPTSSTDRNAALYVDGGIAVQNSVFIGEELNARSLQVGLGDTNSTSTFYRPVGFQSNFTVVGSARLDNHLLATGISTFTNIVRLTDTTGSSTPLTGALVVTGGVGFGSDLNIGRNLSIDGTTNVNGNININGSEANISSAIISLGSSTTSDILAIGLFDSDLLPKISDSYNLGSIDRRWGAVRAVNGVFVDLDVNNDLTSFGNVLFGGNVVLTNGMDVTGVTTFNSGFISSSTAYFQNVIIEGSLNLVGPSTSVGTISTATRSLSVDVESISTNSDFYIGFFDTPTNGEGRTVYVDAGIKYNPSVDEVTLEGDLILNSGEIRTTESNSSFDFFLTNVISSRFCTTAQSLLFGNTVGVTTFKHPLVVFDGNIQISGTGSTSSIITGDGYSNILLRSNQNTEFIGDIIANGDRFDVLNSTFYLADENVTTAFAFGETTLLYIGQSNVGITSIRSPITIFEGDIRINGNDIKSSTNVTNITLVDDSNTIFSGDIQINNNNILANDGNINIALDSNLNTTFSGSIKIGGDQIKASTGETNIFLTGNTLTSIAGDLRIEGDNIQTGAGITCITLGSNFVTFEQDIKIIGNDIRASDGAVNISLESNAYTRLAGDLIVGGDEIRASDDVLAITLIPTSGSVGISSNLIVTNNLITKGPSTILRSNNLKIKDKLINIGLINDPGDINDLIEPSSNESKDIGILLNYFDTQSRKASVYWDNSVSRIALASRVVESSEVLTVSSYGSIEVGGLWVNDCAGQSEVISCSDGVRNLESITIDGGMY